MLRRVMNNHQLIQHVKIRRALWDNTLWDRIDSSAREVMWEDVAEQMKTSKDIVKTRWKNLKDSYRKLLLKSIQNGNRHIRWVYFPYLDFIKHIILNTKPKTLDISAKNTKPPSIDSSYLISIDNNSENEVIEDPLSFSEEFSEVKVEVPKKRKLSDDNIEVDFERCDTSEKLSANYPNDDDLQFLLSLYPHFKQVSTNKKLPLRMKIEKIIYDELYSTDNESNVSILSYQM